jgi:hypothetical protein
MPVNPKAMRFRDFGGGIEQQLAFIYPEREELAVTEESHDWFGWRSAPFIGKGERIYAQSEIADPEDSWNWPRCLAKAVFRQAEKDDDFDWFQNSSGACFWLEAYQCRVENVRHDGNGGHEPRRDAQESITEGAEDK